MFPPGLWFPDQNHLTRLFCYFFKDSALEKRSRRRKKNVCINFSCILNEHFLTAETLNALFLAIVSHSWAASLLTFLPGGWAAWELPSQDRYLSTLWIGPRESIILISPSLGTPRLTLSHHVHTPIHHVPGPGWPCLPAQMSSEAPLSGWSIQVTYPNFFFFLTWKMEIKISTT